MHLNFNLDLKIQITLPTKTPPHFSELPKKPIPKRGQNSPPSSPKIPLEKTTQQSEIVFPVPKKIREKGAPQNCGPFGTSKTPLQSLTL